MTNINVKISPSEAARVIEQHITKSGFTPEKTGSYGNRSPEGREAIMLVFEKYFMRNSSRASLSVMIDDLKGYTTVHAVGSGGGQMTLFKFDWGASENFENLVEQALRSYV